MTRTFRRNPWKHSKFKKKEQESYCSGGIVYHNAFCDALLEGRDGSFYSSKKLSAVEDQYNTWDTGGSNVDTSNVRKAVRNFYKKLDREALKGVFYINIVWYGIVAIGLSASARFR